MQGFWRGSKALRRTHTIVLFAIYSISFMTLTSAYGATITTKSCSLTDVQNAVNSAQRGDTIIVQEGSCNWDSGVTINKAITLQGAGSTSTIITASTNVQSDEPPVHLIAYSAGNSDANTLFRVTGFTFNINNRSKTGFIKVSGTSTRGYATPIRIDHNRILNTVTGLAAAYGYSFAFGNLVKGVIDNNYIHGRGYITMMRWSNAWRAATKTNPEWPIITSWDNGTDNDIFLEDNTIVRTDYYYQTIIGSTGGSFVARYNTFDYSSREGLYFYSSDTHGLQPGPSYGSFGAEMYGNKIIGPGRVGEFRGGIHKIFYNKNISSARPTIKLWETYGPYYVGTAAFSCPSGSLYAGTPSCSIDGRSSNVEKTYLWNNRYASTESGTGSSVNYEVACGGSPYPEASETGARALRENREYWLPETSFDGRTGVGCGALAKRPATCTTGVGYWATDQSCLEVSIKSVGPNPITPIKGTLYRCGPTNQWSAYYTPYKYPHPFRSNDPEPVDPETISAPKGFKLVN